MFELLLQADKSISAGLLDQAERTYWQLIELDPSNSIAVAGLARISLKRGDERLARTFANRALAIDPDSISAQRVIQALEKGTSVPAATAPPDLPLRAAERLEAMSKRRVARLEADDNSAAGGSAQTAKDKGRKSATVKAPEPAAVAAAPEPAAVAAPPAGTGVGRVGRAATGTGRSAGEGSSGQPRRGKGELSRGPAGATEPETPPGPPSRERRSSGRLAAAAAAAAAAAREPSHPRHEPHRAMPSGRRLFEPGPPKSRPVDPFAAAEMAAAVAAVDAMDDAVEAEVEATAVVAGTTQAEAEALVGSAAGEPPATAAPPSGASVAATAKAAATGTGSRAPEVAAGSDLAGEEMSEREAEMEALREAVAIVTAERESAGAGADRAADDAGTADEASRTSPPAATTGTSKTTSGASSEARPPAPASADAATAPRKKSLFRRLRGN